MFDVGSAARRRAAAECASQACQGRMSEAETPNGDASLLLYRTLSAGPDSSARVCTLRSSLATARGESKLDWLHFEITCTSGQTPALWNHSVNVPESLDVDKIGQPSRSSY